MRAFPLLFAAAICVVAAAASVSAQAPVPSCSGVADTYIAAVNLGIPFATTSAVLCAQYCFETPACAAWVWYPNDPNCWPKSSTGTIGGSLGVTSGGKPSSSCVNPAPVPSCSGVADTYNVGSNMAGFVTETPLHCAQWCFETPACVAWMWHATDSTCYPQSSVWLKESEAGFTSGGKPSSSCVSPSSTGGAAPSSTGSSASASPLLSWSANVTYAVGTSVNYSSISYRSLISPNVGNRPDLYSSSVAVSEQALFNASSPRVDPGFYPGNEQHAGQHYIVLVDCVLTGLRFRFTAGDVISKLRLWRLEGSAGAYSGTLLGKYADPLSGSSISGWHTVSIPPIAARAGDRFTWTLASTGSFFPQIHATDLAQSAAIALYSVNGETGAWSDYPQDQWPTHTAGLRPHTLVVQSAWAVAP